jgi:hypothetical protein
VIARHATSGNIIAVAAFVIVVEISSERGRQTRRCAIWHKERSRRMFSAVAVVLLCAGFATGYGLRAHISRRRRTRRVTLLPTVHFPRSEDPANSKQRRKDKVGPAL